MNSGSDGSSPGQFMGREAALSAAMESLSGRASGQYDFGVVARQQQRHAQQPQLPQRPQPSLSQQQAQHQDFCGVDGTVQLQQQQQQQQQAQRQHHQQQSSFEHVHRTPHDIIKGQSLDATVRKAPEEHFFTISKNGTILGATDTVTGFPPSALLMQSSYDSVQPHDLIGLRAIKSRYWDKGQPDVEAFFRRRTVDDDWVWLTAKVVSYIDVPVPGLIVHERLAKDTSLAELVSRICCISAVLATTVETAFEMRKEEEAANAIRACSTGEKDVESARTRREGLPSELSSMLGGADDASVLKALIGGESPAAGGDSTSTNNLSQQRTISVASCGEGEGQNNDPSNPMFSVLAQVRSGVCLDMSKISLSKAELKMVVFVLTGRITVEELGLLVASAMNSPTKDLGGALDLYVAEQGHTPLPKGQSTLQGSVDCPLPLFRKSHASRSLRRSRNAMQSASTSSPQQPVRRWLPPPLSALNLSYTHIGTMGADLVSEILHMDTPKLRTLDLGFCGIDERGILSLCRGLTKRKNSGLPQLQGLILAGNTLSYKAAKELGVALSLARDRRMSRRKSGFGRRAMSRDGEGTGYDEDDEWDDDDEEEYVDIMFGTGPGRSRVRDKKDKKDKKDKQGAGAAGVKSGGTVPPDLENQGGLLLLHLGCTSLRPDALYQLLLGLGQACPIKELSVASNNLGPEGSALLVAFLEGKGIAKYKKGQCVMPHLDRLDMSNNKLGNAGTSKLTRAISKRVKINFVDLRLSSNEIGAAGIETMMNKLLQHNILSLSLDNNTIGDRGCQLVAASLPSMHQLSRLSLSFNQIGSRGVNTLMRSLVGCESMVHLGLSGNVMKISGAIAMGFALSQHPRLSELEVENCCLSQVSQCHIAAGIISNRWVPMKTLNGFRVGPPMVAIGALDIMAQHLKNDECFRIRRDMQMKTILQWMESNRAKGEENVFSSDDIMSQNSEVSGMPSQSAYLRMLDWLSRIPFDEDELADLRSYFYDPDGGDNERGSDGNINLRLRGDLLAALGSEVVDEIREDPIFISREEGSSVGLSISCSESEDNDLPALWNVRKKARGTVREPSPTSHGGKRTECLFEMHSSPSWSANCREGKKRRNSCDLASEIPEERSGHKDAGADAAEHRQQKNSPILENGSTSNISRASSKNSNASNDDGKGSHRNPKTRISMFKPFARKLEMLKAHAQDMMDQEPDPVQQDIIAQQFAEASLTLLRQLRYHCMNSGLDGWRHSGKLRRKVLIVDDSMVTRKMVSRAFEKANFIVDTAENGQEGVAKLKESIYDIAFMDIDMPVMNGFDATKELRQWEDLKRPGVRQPICALTAAYVDDFERSELMKFKEAGLDVMESKPCNFPRLFKVVDDVSPMFSDLSITVTQHQNIST